MPREVNRETLTLSVKPGTKDRLTELAERYGFKWGSSPNPSALISAYAAGELPSIDPADLTTDQIRALVHATKVLAEAGLKEEAQCVGDLLTRREDLPPDLRARIYNAFGPGLTYTWRSRLEDLIAAERVFEVAYRGRYAKGPTTLTVRYARIRFWNRAHYLEAWTDEADEHAILPELAHNRQLRLDRISYVQERSGAFTHTQLDSVEAKLRIYGTLRKGYEPAEDDIPIEEEDGTEGDVPVGESGMVIQRRVYFPFEFFKTVMSYGPDCEVVSPPVLRQGVSKRLAKAVKRYHAE